MPGRRRSTGLQSFSLRKPSDVDIVLDDEDDQSFVSSYTTLDTISGKVLVRCGKDTSFQELEISLEGVTETCTYPEIPPERCAEILCHSTHLVSRMLTNDDPRH